MTVRVQSSRKSLGFLMMRDRHLLLMFLPVFLFYLIFAYLPMVGLVMGFVYYKTGSLWLTMLIHFVNNGTSVVLAQIPSLEETEYWIDIIPAGTYAVLSVVGVIALVACLWAFSRIPVERKEGNIDPVTLEVE